MCNLQKHAIFAKYIDPVSRLSLAVCMSFSHKFKTLRSGNSYDSKTQPEISTLGDESTGEAETGMIEGSEENGIRFSPELVDERIKANLEPLHAQITALTEMMDRLIQNKSAKESATASSPGTPNQYEWPYSEVPGSSRFPTVAPLTTAGYSPDNEGNLHFFENEECNFNDHFKLFHQFWLRYHNLMFSSTCVNVRADSE